MNHFAKQYDKSTGFTLIELLVVVAIIGVLAAILFPVFARARENARRSSCMSNLKQIGLGVRMYSQDYDEKLPPYRQVWWIDGDSVVTEWTEIISPYTSHYSKRTQLYRCPSSWLKLNVAGRGNDFRDFEAGNYSANRAVFPQDAGISVAALVSPSTTYMIFDGSTVGLSAASIRSPDDDKLQYLPGTGPGTPSDITIDDGDSKGWKYAELENDFISGRHFGGVNMLFGDGHVKWLQSQVVWREAWKGANGAFLQW